MRMSTAIVCGLATGAACGWVASRFINQSAHAARPAQVERTSKATTAVTRDGAGNNLGFDPTTVILEAIEQGGGSILENVTLSSPLRAADLDDSASNRAMLAAHIESLARKDSKTAPPPATAPGLLPASSLQAESASGAALREAARELDQAADRLDEESLYDVADRLRAEARRLRIEARSADRPTAALAPVRDEATRR